MAITLRVGVSTFPQIVLVSMNNQPSPKDIAQVQLFGDQRCITLSIPIDTQITEIAKVGVFTVEIAVELICRIVVSAQCMGSISQVARFMNMEAMRTGRYIPQFDSDLHWSSETLFFEPNDTFGLTLIRVQNTYPAKSPHLGYYRVRL